MWFVRTSWAALSARSRSRWPDGGTGARSSARGASRVAISNGHRSATPSVSTRQGYAGISRRRRSISLAGREAEFLASEPTRDYVPEPELTVADRVALGHVLALTREDARQIARGNGDEPPPKNDETSAADSVFLLADQRSAQLLALLRLETRIPARTERFARLCSAVAGQLLEHESLGARDVRRILRTADERGTCWPG